MNSNWLHSARYKRKKLKSELEYLNTLKFLNKIYIQIKERNDVNFGFISFYFVCNSIKFQSNSFNFPFIMKNILNTCSFKPKNPVYLKF